jgi:mono/diheme cytochrome c family protein
MERRQCRISGFASNFKLGNGCGTCGGPLPTIRQNDPGDATQPMTTLTAPAAPMFRVRSIMTGFGFSLVLAGILASRSAGAADLENGRVIAQARCVECHVVFNGQPSTQIAEPLDNIATKYGFDVQSIVNAIIDQHPEKGASMRREDAADVAAYIATIKDSEPQDNSPP